MTAIDRLLRQAGELNAASMKELSPALQEMASVQAGVADALEPILEARASVAGAQPFRYGFVLPAEPPELKPDQAEPAPAQGKAEVNLGPVNVYAIAGEIQKALNSVEQDSANLQGAFSTYVPGPTSLPPAAPQEGRHQPAAWPQSIKPERPDRAAGEPKPPQGTAVARKIASEEWVEESIKRSSRVMKDLREVQENIISSTITKEKVQELSVDALSIGNAAAMGSAPPRLPEKPQKEEEPARPIFTYAPPVVIKPRAPAESLPPVQQEIRNTAQPQPRPGDKPGTPGLAQTAPASEAREPALPGTAKAPTIRLRASPVVAPAVDADFNARSLSKARSMEAESSRPQPEAGSPRREKEEKPGKVEWPVITTGSSDRPPFQVTQNGEAPRQAWSGPSHAPEPGRATVGTQVVQVIRSFGAMGEALRAVSEVGAATSFSLPAAVVPPIAEAGAPILNAMAGTAPLPRPETGEIGRLAGAANTGLASGSAQLAAAPVTQAGSGGSPAVIFLPGTGAHAARPAWGLAANISAAQASQRSEMAMVQRLIQAAPHMAGSIAPQAPAIYDSGRGLPFPGMVTPAAASGAENIVNITVPQAAQSKVSETNTTTRVANFHNTFNITVNLQSAEERDLKELGKKIGQLLSEELKRYGGLS